MPRAGKLVRRGEDVRAAVLLDADGDDVGMLEQQQRVGDAAGLAILDQPRCSSRASAYGTSPSRRTSRRTVQPVSSDAPEAYSCDSSNVLDALLDVGHELVGDRAVDQAVIVAERQVAPQADADHVVDHHRPLLDRADAEDGHLRLVDDRQAELGAEVAGVGDGEGAAVDFFGVELLRPRPIGDVVDGLRQAEDVLLAGLLHHRHDQPVVERDGDAEVDVLRSTMLSPSIEALTIGWRRRQSTTTLAMNAVKVSFAPCCSSQSFFCLAD